MQPLVNNPLLSSLDLQLLQENSIDVKEQVNKNGSRSLKNSKVIFELFLSIPKKTLNMDCLDEQGAKKIAIILQKSGFFNFDKPLNSIVISRNGIKVNNEAVLEHKTHQTSRDWKDLMRYLRSFKKKEHDTNVSHSKEEVQEKESIERPAESMGKKNPYVTITDGDLNRDASADDEDVISVDITKENESTALIPTTFSNTSYSTHSSETFVSPPSPIIASILSPAFRKKPKKEKKSPISILKKKNSKPLEFDSNGNKIFTIYDLSKKLLVSFSPDTALLRLNPKYFYDQILQQKYSKLKNRYLMLKNNGGNKIVAKLTSRKKKSRKVKPCSSSDQQLVKYKEIPNTSLPNTNLMIQYQGTPTTNLHGFGTPSPDQIIMTLKGNRRRRKVKLLPPPSSSMENTPLVPNPITTANITPDPNLMAAFNQFQPDGNLT